MARGGEKRVVDTGDGATWEGVNKIQGKNENNNIPYCGEDNQSVLK